MASSSSTEDMKRIELYKYTHVFRSLSFDIRFGVVDATKFPTIVSAPSDIPEVSAFVCLYGLPKPPTPAFDRLFAQMESRLLSLRETPARDDEFGMAELLVGESMGHIMRRIACFESDVVVQRQTFEKAYSVYEGVILALCHSSLNESLHSIRKGPKKAIIFQPFEGLETYTPDARRLISHCFAGMAICILMSEKSASKYVSLASEAVCLEAVRPMELACTLRMLPLIMSSTASALSLSESGKTYYMFKEVSTKVLLPLMLRMKRQDLYDAELSLIDPDQQSKCAQFAQDLVTHINTRLSSPAPLATVRTHVVDGKIIERNCAACGVWDRTGDNHRRCNACKLVYYCGKECQKAHWKLHKSVCNK